MFSTEIKKANNELKKIVRNLSEECNKISEDSKVEYVKNMPASQTVVPKMYCYTDSAKERIFETCKNHSDKMKEIINEVRDKTAKDLIATPSDEATNTIQLLKLRKDIPASEFQIYVDKYGKNPLVNSLLSDIAHEKNIPVAVPVNEEMRRMNALDELAGSIDRNVNAHNISKEGISVGIRCGIESQIDIALPCDE